MSYKTSDSRASPSPSINYDRVELAPAPESEDIPLRETRTHSRLGKSLSMPTQNNVNETRADVNVAGSTCSATRPPLLRMGSIREGLIHGVRFLGISVGEDYITRIEHEKEDGDKWLGKRLKRLNRKYGLKASEASETCQGRNFSDDLLDGLASTPRTEKSIEMRVSTDPRGRAHLVSTPVLESDIRGSPEQGSRPHMERKASGIWIMKESIGSFLKRGYFATHKPGPVSHLSSFKPNQVDQLPSINGTTDITVDSGRRSVDSSRMKPLSSKGNSDLVKYSLGSSADSPQIHLAGFSDSGEIEAVSRPTVLSLSPKFNLKRGTDLPAVAESCELFENSQESKCLPFDKSYTEDAMRNVFGQQRSTFFKTPFTTKLSTPLSVASLDDEVFFDVTPSTSLGIPFPVPVEAMDRISEYPEEPTPDYSLDDEKEVVVRDEMESSQASDIFRQGATFEGSGPHTHQGMAGRSQLELGDSGTFSRPKISYLGHDPSKMRQEVGEPIRPKVTPEHHQRIPFLKRQDWVDHGFRDKNQMMDDLQTTVLQSKQHIVRRTRRGGEGAFGRFLKREMKKQKELPENVRKQMAAAEDERPFFTYWITSVQIIITLLSIMLYGFGPFGFERVERRADVMHASFTHKMVGMYEPANIWLGPSFADLIRLGAKYSPCMRQERNVISQINQDRRLENMTGCCIYHDGGGCFQTGEQSCPKLIATLHKWGSDVPPSRIKRKLTDSLNFDPTYTGEVNVVTESLLSGNGRRAGAVCGQDPFYCEVPASIEPHEWPDDLTKWPICTRIRQDAQVVLPPHMTCHRTGRPCCINLQGRCRIATKEYCDFVRGFFHENATLCSQVNCLGDVCGMFPFFKKDHPDQFYRLFLSLFLHAGIIHCIVSVVLQLWLMRDLEYLIGWQRMALLYLSSGIAGNLASAIFVPYHPEVGPAGSQVGIQAALLVDAFYHRELIEKPYSAYCEHLFVLLVLFFGGLFPWIDNWSHIFGFIFGLLISLAIFPYVTLFDPKKDPDGYRKERTIRIVIVVFSIISILVLFGVLCYVFYSNVEFSCSWCEKLNCLSILSRDSHFCDNQGLSLHSLLPI